MNDDFPSPDQHARGWRLVSASVPTDGATTQGWIDAGGNDPTLLLVLDSDGEWWGIAPDCRACGAPLREALRHAGKGINTLHCASCHVAHGPGIDDCDCVALMVVDDEIYAAPALK